MPRRSYQQQIITMSIRCCSRHVQSCGPSKSSEFWIWGSLAMSSTKNESFSFEGPRPLSTARSTCAILSKTSGAPLLKGEVAHHELAQTESGVSQGHEFENVILRHDDPVLVLLVGGKLLRRGVCSQGCYVVGLEGVPCVQGLLGGLPGAVDGGQQVWPVLVLRCAVAIENLLHVHRGPRGRLEVRELLALHLLISKCPDEFGSKVTGTKVAAKPSHDLLQLADQGVVVLLLPFHQEEHVVTAVGGEALSRNRGCVEVGGRHAVAVDDEGP